MKWCNCRTKILDWANFFCCLLLTMDHCQPGYFSFEWYQEDLSISPRKLPDAGGSTWCLLARQLCAGAQPWSKKLGSSYRGLPCSGRSGSCATGFSTTLSLAAHLWRPFPVRWSPWSDLSERTLCQDFAPSPHFSLSDRTVGTLRTMRTYPRVSLQLFRVYSWECYTTWLDYPKSAALEIEVRTSRSFWCFFKSSYFFLMPS